MTSPRRLLVLVSFTVIGCGAPDDGTASPSSAASDDDDDDDDGGDDDDDDDDDAAGDDDDDLGDDDDDDDDLGDDDDADDDDDDAGDDDDDDDAGDDDDDAGDDDDDGFDCENLPALPASISFVEGPQSSEDFVLDPSGNMISASQGTLYKSQYGMAPTTLFPSVLSRQTAGTRMFSNGDIVIADVEEGTLVRFDAVGNRTVLLGGLEYPNGIAVDLDDLVYVAEHAAGRVRRVDPDNGEFEIIAEGIFHPNGLSFSPDYHTLYVGSFGAGTVHAIDDAAGAASLRLLADKVGWPLEAPADLPQAAWDVCSGAEEMDPCLVGDDSIGHCTSIDDGEMFCFLEWENKKPGDVPNHYYSACNGKDAGEACEVDLWGDETSGECVVYGSKPLCWPDNIQGLGDLDGVGVDICGNIYVTQYVAGIVWRLSSDGADQAVVADLGQHTEWIPNMNWGSDVGGWDPMKLYVMSRRDDRLFELDLQIPGKREPHL